MSIPGPQSLIAGDMQAGYFGTVPASELWTGTELATAVGITQGTVQHDDTGWLKFAYKGKILFRPMKAFRHSISWDHINAAGCVFGTKTVEKDGLPYKVRLMKGALTDPSQFANADRGAMGSEWNRLMLPIHEQAATKAWSYPAYVEADIPNWGIGFTDADLLTRSTHGNGSATWCQETSMNSTTNRVVRGNLGVSAADVNNFADVRAIAGWAPVLELLISITGQDKSLGIKVDEFSHLYAVLGSDGTIANITEKLNGEVINSYDNPTELSREFTVTKEQLKTLPFFQTLTIEIIATDDMGASTTRKLTFTRGAELLPDDTPLLDVVEATAGIPSLLSDVKTMLSTTVIDKGGTVPDNPLWTDIDAAIAGIELGKKSRSGEAVISSDNTLTITGLDFEPSYIVGNLISSQVNATNNSFLSFVFRKNPAPSGHYTQGVHNTVVYGNSGNFQVSLVVPKRITSDGINGTIITGTVAYINKIVEWTAIE